MGKLRHARLQQRRDELRVQNVAGDPDAPGFGGVGDGLELFGFDGDLIAPHAPADGGLNAVAAHVDELVDGGCRVLRGPAAVAGLRTVGHDVVQSVILGHKPSCRQTVGALRHLDGLPVAEEFLCGMVVFVISHTKIPDGGDAGLSPGPESPVVVFDVPGDDVHMGVDDAGQNGGEA